MNMGWAALVLLAALAGAYKSNWVDTRYQPIFRPPGVGSVGYTGDPNGLMFREDTKTYHAFWQCKVGEIDGKTLWCHALSKDLATWTHLPYEAAMSYSGGATQTAGRSSSAAKRSAAAHPSDWPTTVTRSLSTLSSSETYRSARAAAQWIESSVGAASPFVAKP